jgi:hypothetical protein
MALYPCRECGREISSDAKKCPNCGAKDPIAGTQTLRYLFGAVIVVLIFAYCQTSGSSTSEQTSTSNAQAESGIDTASKELAYIEAHQDSIKKRLKDPESAQFRNVAVYYDIAPAVCGEVNSKNSFGGYAGFQRFVSAGNINVLENDMQPGEMTKVWAQLCTKRSGASR